MIVTEKIQASELIKHYNKKIISFPSEELTDGLVQGKLGLVLYFLMIYEQTKEEVYVKRITEILTSIFKSFETTEKNTLLSDSSFGDGVSGLGWVLLLLMEKGILDEEYEKEIAIFNDIAYEYAEKHIDKNNFDFLHGAIGVLLFLEKSKNKLQFNKLIDKLYDLTLSNQNLFNTESDDPYISAMNFGFPHGYLSIIKILINAQRSFGEDKKYKHIIEKCVVKIMNHLDKDYKVEGINIYKPHKVYYKKNQLEAHQNKRLAWCNSDLSWIYILSKIDHQNQENKYKDIIDLISKSVVKRREMGVTGVENHHFCHGSSGVAQLFSELHKITENKEYKEAKEYWNSRTIEYLKKDMDKELTKRDMSLYYGKLGALLSLYDGNGKFTNDWKEAFLIN